MNRKRKYPGIKGRRPDKKFTRGVKAKNSSMTFTEIVPLNLDKMIQNRIDDETDRVNLEYEYNQGLMDHINTGSWD